MDLSNLVDKLDSKCLSYPCPDLVKCETCGKTYKVDKCPTEEDGGWETGYHTVPVCPKCEDGGELLDYKYSFIQMIKYKIFEWRHK